MLLPWTQRKPASSTVHLDESIMIGTRLMSGSEAIRLRKSTMSFSESSMPSSMQISMIWAPFSTCCLAMASAASRFCSSLTSFRNCGEPATLVRSPTFTKFTSLVMLNGSRPLRRQIFFRSGICRGGSPFTTFVISRM